jgi:hypothetical protein
MLLKQNYILKLVESRGVVHELTPVFVKISGIFVKWRRMFVVLLHCMPSINPRRRSARLETRCEPFVYNVPLASQTGTVGYLIHKGDDKDHGGADGSHALKAGANEIWRMQGDLASFTANTLGNTVPDLTAARVHCKRFDGNFPAGACTSGTAAGWTPHAIRWSSSSMASRPTKTTRTAGPTTSASTSAR